MTPLVAITMFGLVATDVTHRMNAEPKNVEELYAMYNRYELWLPPKGTQLVRWVDKQSQTVYGRQKVQLQFMLRPRTKTEAAQIRSGGSEWTEHRNSRLTVVKPTLEALQGDVEFSTDDWLEIAIMAHHLGWKEIAKESFKQANIKPSPNPFGMTKVRGDATCQMQTFLRNHAWSHHYHSLLDVKTNRTHSYTMMKRILDDDPRFRTIFNLELLDHLQTTLEQKKRNVGFEKWIDELCEIDVRLYEPFAWTVEPTAYDRLCIAGFDAVPLLIEHLGDPRLSRTGKFRGENLGSWVEVERVRSFCEYMLQDLSAGQYAPKTGTAIEERKNLAKQWFERAKAIGEEKWLIDHAMADDSPNEVLLRVLAAKHTSRFLSLYRANIGKPKFYFSPFLVALGHAKLTREQILDVLVETALNPNPNSALDALKVLEQFDRRAFASCVSHYLTRPAHERPSDETFEQWFGLLDWLHATYDSRCWDTLSRNLGQWIPHQRIRFAEGLLEPSRVSTLLRDPLRLRVLDLLWDDHSVRHGRDQHLRLNYPDSYYTYPQIAVRDAVTLAVADYLDIDIPWKLDRSPAEWDGLRKKVQAAFADARKTTR